MRILSRLFHSGSWLVLLAVIGLLAVACDNNTPANPTPVAATNSTPGATNPTAVTADATALPTQPSRSVAIGPALQTGGAPLTFKTALTKAMPEAKAWNTDALLELASLVSPTGPGEGAWTLTFITPDGQQRRLISVSSVDTQTQGLNGSVSGHILDEVKAHSPLLEQAIDSPAIIDKVKALNYEIAADTQVKIVYYASAENVGVSAYKNPVVQVRILKGESAIQLTLDALTGDLVNKVEQ
jgi:hypothetical protein